MDTPQRPEDLVGQPAPDLMLTSQHGPRLAYAVPVLAGLMVTLWWR